MKIHGVSRVVVRAGALVVLAASSANADIVWRRANDWVPGTVAGSTLGNPGNVNGAPVWRYETAQGGGLGSVNPWYKQPTSLMTWDPAWYATGWGVWSHGDDASPPVLPGRLIHNVAASTWGDVPIVRWMNPLGNGVALDIAGTLTVNWNGANGLGRPVNVDVVIAKYTAASNTTSILFSDTVSKPNPFPSVGDSVFLPVNLSQIAMNAGDSIIISHRGQNPVGPLGAWVNLYDNLALSAVPAPGSFALLSLAGLAAVRRKRR